MKHCHLWMLLGCVLILAGTFLLPRLGVPLTSGPLLAILMIVCCVGPMLFSALCSRPRGRHDDEGERVAEGDARETPGEGRGGACH